MKEVDVYLTFDGNCRAAMEFYARCLGGELMAATFGESPIECPPEAKDRIIHARITKGAKTLLMASDTMPGMPFQPGSNFSISLQCESPEEAERLFAALSEGGAVTMPMQETFWAARFGMAKDRFGIAWMFNADKPLSA